MLDINDPKIIIFLVETYEKENRIRLNWSTKYKHLLDKSITLGREPTNYTEKDILKYIMKTGMRTITRDQMDSKSSGCRKSRFQLEDPSSAYTSKDFMREHSLVALGFGDPKEDPRLARPDTDPNPDPLMRPIDSVVRKVLYGPKPEEGREVYLKKRNKLDPEQKYYLPESESVRLGWRLSESTIRPCAPKFGAVRTLYTSPVGPQPDPDHYKSADVKGLDKCP